jgi:phosphoserine aminotransferase
MTTTTPFPNEGYLSGRIADDDRPQSRTSVRRIPIFLLAPAPSAPAGRSKNSPTRPWPFAPREDRQDKLKQAIDLTREILEVPADYRIGIVPASDTGAVEMALWSLLGERGVDMVAWESFGEGWVTDVVKQLKLKDVRKIEAGYGELPDLSNRFRPRRRLHLERHHLRRARSERRLHPADRKGLTICDATSAAFAQNLDFAKLDVVTFSWQKVLGGEGAHGMLILSPRAVERLETYTPAWPLPKIFRMTSGGKLIEGIFTGETINTPSMLCVEDYLDALLGEVGRRSQGADRPCRRQCQGDRRLRGARRLDRQPRGDPETAPTPRSA